MGVLSLLFAGNGEAEMKLLVVSPRHGNPRHAVDPLRPPHVICSLRERVDDGSRGLECLGGLAFSGWAKRDTAMGSNQTGVAIRAVLFTTTPAVIELEEEAISVRRDSL